MKIIQSFWTGNQLSGSQQNGNQLPGNSLDNPGGWPSPEYHWMSWTLSCLQLRKIYGEVELITDTLGKEILIDRLNLPYTKVTIALDNILDGFPKEVWALAKIHSYSLQEKPFLHVDGDFFLWTPFREDLLQAEIIVQNQEWDLPLYRATLDEINEHFPVVPSCFQKNRYAEAPVRSINAGIIGGNNVDFFKGYRNAAFDFIKANIDKLSAVKISNLNFIFEQFYLSCLAEQQHIPVTYASDKIVDSLIYGEYVNFSKIPGIQFIHPVGGHKKNMEVCDHLSKKLWMEYPGWFENIIETLRDSGISLYNKCRFSTGIITVDPNEHPQNPGPFARTMAAIRHLSADLPSTVSTHHPASASDPSPRAVTSQTLTADPGEEEAVGRLLNTLSLKDRDRQLLSEVFEVEKLKKQAFLEAFRNTRELPVLWARDLANYEHMQHNFGRLTQSNQSSSEFTFIQNSRLKFRPVTNNWTYDHANPLEEIVQYNFGDIARLDELMVFVPQVLRMEVDELFLDPLDALLVNYCGEAKTVSDILQHASGAFEEEEIAGNYQGFYSLITGSIIRLSYLNILHFS